MSSNQGQLIGSFLQEACLVWSVIVAEIHHLGLPVSSLLKGFEVENLQALNIKEAL